MSFERLEPGTPEWTAYLANHTHRYAFAAEQLARLARPGRVLDAATGVGYGAAQIADACGVEVVAVDRDEAALAVARQKFSRARVRFEQDDCATLANGASHAAPYAAVVSFETVEHLREPERFVRRVGDLIAPGGLLIVSTPNRSVNEAQRGTWDHHEREYTAAEFEALLTSSGFQSIQLFGQRLTAMGELRRDLRGEINRLRFNPITRLGFWIQRRLRRVSLPPALPEQPSDFEIVPLASAADCDRQGAGGPFVIIAIATRPGHA